MPPEPGAPASGSRKRFALLGDPVEHSLSPRIHNAAFHALGLDAEYAALRCAAAEVPALMRSLAGGNVTVPHKAIAAESVERASDAVRATGACNTFWTEHGRLLGDNTDVVGFERALRELIGVAKGADVLLLGAGGAASAALFALLRAGVARVTVVNRTRRRAEAMIARIARDPSRVRLGYDGSGTYDLAVNATPVGLRSNEQPRLPDGVVIHAAFDMVYSPAGTAWVDACRAAGIPAVDGRPMLLYQAAAAFERWTERAAPLDVMRAALDSAG